MAASMLRVVHRCSRQQNVAVRTYSQQAKRPTFISRIIDNLKDEMEKNKEMKENLKKFREEAQKLENTDALKKAREKFQNVEAEATKSSDILKEKVTSLKDKVQEALGDAQNNEFVKKAGQITEEIGKTAKGATETIVDAGKKISQTTPFEVLKKEMEFSGARFYRPPAQLRMRKEITDEGSAQTIEINEDAKGMVLHKDFKFYESWQNFKNKNPYVNKVLDWKSKYDESENPVVRASRALTEKVADIMGGLFQKTELSEALTEICKMDPDFSKEEFLKQCELDIIPNILEAMVRGDLEILKDWCHEAPYSILASPLKQAFAMGYHLNCQVLDVDNVDLLMGKVVEQGPILVISFVAQQKMCVQDKAGTVIEGSLDKIMRVNYVWVLCRDQTELDPRAAWRLMDLSANSSEQLI